MSIHTYIPWSELMSVEVSEDELNQIISSLDKISTFKFLTDVNNFLALFPTSYEKEKFEYIQKFLIANFLNEDALDEYNRKFARQNISTLERPIFRRQQILSVMKKVLLYSLDEGGKTLNDNKLFRQTPRHRVQSIMYRMCRLIFSELRRLYIPRACLFITRHSTADWRTSNDYTQVGYCNYWEVTIL